MFARKEQAMERSRCEGGVPLEAAARRFEREAQQLREAVLEAVLADVARLAGPEAPPPGPEACEPLAGALGLRPEAVAAAAARRRWERRGP